MQTLFKLPFDKPLAGVGAVRTWSGMICQAVLCKAMGWRETNTGGADKGDCVPDAWDDLYPVEIKAVTLHNKLSGKSVIYKFRIEKEAKAYPNLRYAFMGHPKLDTPKTLSELHERLSRNMFDVCIVPAFTVHDFVKRTCDLKPVKTWNVNAPEYNRIGYNREGYSDGYYCPNVKEFFLTSRKPYEAQATHEGRKFKLNIYSSL